MEEQTDTILAGENFRQPGAGPKELPQTPSLRLDRHSDLGASVKECPRRVYLADYRTS